ncbi:MAG TPA: tripartite tricarboxylate transporter substrate binding protein [Noviherbaspirillum sp.]|nr:tripartite tricarboxylate transporter substrate binding protein [Noviherbaspirillum sp.]
MTISLSFKGAVSRCVFGAVALLAGVSAVQADSYPSKPIKLVVPYPAGGGNDLLARAIKTRWEQAFGQPVIVENKPGANGSIATEFVARAPNDGYTLLMGSVATHAINPSMYPQIRYRADKDFEPLALVGSTPLILTVHPSVKANTVAELVAEAKKQPGKLTYASVGMGSAGHLAGELFTVNTGTDILHVPYKGISQASTDLVGGQVNMAFSNVINVLPMIKTGKLKPLGVTSKAPLDVLPNVPPISKSVPNYSVDLWWALFAPAGTPKQVIDKLNAETNRYLSEAEAKEKWAKDGITLLPSTPAQLKALVAEDAKKWADVIKTAKITGE